MIKSVLITGGNGFIGKYLSESLSSAGYIVFILTRVKDMNCKFHQYLWNVEKSEIDPDALINKDYIIHLAGVNIGERRWTKSRKQQIIDSRVKSIELIFKTLKDTDQKPKALISASAIGYYGSVTTDRIFKEDDPPGKDYIGRVCRQWEDAANQFNELGIRVVKLRTGIVLSELGGILKKLTLPVKSGFGSALGNGKQFMPWIHIEDLCNIYLKAIENDLMSGAYNAVAIEHITNNEFTRRLSRMLKRPFWFPRVPAYVLKIMFGEGVTLLLHGSRIASDKLRNSGYDFIFADFDKALKSLFNSQ